MTQMPAATEIAQDLRASAGWTANAAAALGAAWGVIGVAALLGHALWRLVPIAVDGLRGPLPAWAWLATAGWLGFMAYFEGYRGFQLGFAPRVVARAAEVARDPRPLRLALAPLYCMSLFAAPRRRLVVSWSLVATIVALVVGISRLGQPWRGVVDAGVVVGLGWGFVALGVHAVRQFLRR
jgi:hypothetical protein